MGTGDRQFVVFEHQDENAVDRLIRDTIHQRRDSVPLETISGILNDKLGVEVGYKLIREEELLVKDNLKEQIERGYLLENGNVSDKPNFFDVTMRTPTLDCIYVRQGIPKYLRIEHLRDSEIEEIERRAKNRKFSTSCFLGDNESLREIIERDNETLRKYGVTHEQIADILRRLMQGGMTLDSIRNSTRFLVDDKFRVRMTVYFGKQQCPFWFVEEKVSGGYHLYTCDESGFDYDVRNMHTGESFSFSGLLPHLIGEHHFFEGGVPYRLDPEEIIRVLELAPTAAKRQVSDPTVDYVSMYIKHKVQDAEETGAALLDDFPQASVEVLKNALLPEAPRRFLEVLRGLVIHSRYIGAWMDEDTRKPYNDMEFYDHCKRLLDVYYDTIAHMAGREVNFDDYLNVDSARKLYSALECVFDYVPQAIAAKYRSYQNENQHIFSQGKKVYDQSEYFYTLLSGVSPDKPNQAIEEWAERFDLQNPTLLQQIKMTLRD